MSYIKKIEKEETSLRNMTDGELAAFTDKFREQIKKGVSPHKILPKAFAVVRETAFRTIGQFHYKEQLMGGVGLYKGYIIEMKTGEGKTLAATTAAYLKALEGKVHIVTVNDYLAQSNRDQMAKIYGFLGLTTGCIKDGMTTAERKREYAKDIVYGTNKEFCFDYLRDRLVMDKSERVQGSLDYAIIDEIDSILIDEARTPLIISCNQPMDTDILAEIDRFVKSLKECDEKKESVISRLNAFRGKIQPEAGDYIVDRAIRAINLTNAGVIKAEEHFNLEYFSGTENTQLVHFILLSLKANYLYERGKDYIVSDGKVCIVDSYTGRVLQSRKFGDGLHQAIEAKEGVKITPSTLNNASTTFKTYFSLYKSIAGMTGTAASEKKEFKKIYGLRVKKIPTHKKKIRKDLKDKVFISKNSKYQQMIEDIAEIHETGQPILIGSPTVAISEEISALLAKKGLQHTVLNAKNHKKEASIIAQAGRLGAITVSTNMAGRGTDIMLGGNPESLVYDELLKEYKDEERVNAYISSTTPKETDEEMYKRFCELYKIRETETKKEKQEVLKTGGLYIIGAERNTARRIDNQLIGRSGRQGDAGKSCYYISAEDDIVKTYNFHKSSGYIKKKPRKLTKIGIGRLIKKSQKQCQDAYFEQRRLTTLIDDIDDVERGNVYALREMILSAEETEQFVSYVIERVADSTIVSAVKPLKYKKMKESDICDIINAYIQEKFELNESFSFTYDGKKKRLNQIQTNLVKFFEDLYNEKTCSIKRDIHASLMEVEKQALLRTIDKEWSDYLSVVSHYANSLGNFAMGTIKPIEMYKQDVISLHWPFYASLQEEILRRLMQTNPRRNIVLHKLKGKTLNLM